MEKKKETSYKIRPAARLIHTIGRDLIGDSYAALVELVKNSYDADASKVEIIFEYKKIDGNDSLHISVVDDGHGMSFDTVINKWLVPATNDKLKQKRSLYKKRYLQGRKGIGRFAASILGQEMTLETINKEGEKSFIIVDWTIFDSDIFLEEIELLVENSKTTKESGTTLEIIAKRDEEDDKISVWDRKTIEKLINELRKLISPFNDFENDKFNINISFKNCPFEEYNNQKFDIETYPIIELYDYRIHGIIDKNGNAHLYYENNVVIKSKQKEEIKKHFQLSDSNKYCGQIEVDFRIFDRESEAIDNLINKGLIDPVTKKHAGKNEAKRMLNNVYGAKIYKNNFRIRPYGTDGDDWLEKDKDRIQNMPLIVSNNQLVGFVTIQREELSYLEEKSARDGLKENEYFYGLKELCNLTLRELELRRFSYRRKSQKGRKSRNSIQNTISNLFSFNKLSNNIQKELQKHNVKKENIDSINAILKEEEREKAVLLEDIQKTIAIYQGQATLGKIINFILHEGRKPIQFLNSETHNLKKYLEFYNKTKEEKYLSEVTQSLNGFSKNGKLISDLFKRVNPLASQRNGNKKSFNIKNTLFDSSEIFKHSCQKNNIVCSIICAEYLTIYGWEQDLFTAITNLIENSIFWLSTSEVDNKEINIKVSENESELVIVFTDNGPGLTDEEIETDIIFEPGYSRKQDGTGIGLAIAGEAIERLNGTLKARKCDSGVYFQIEVEK